MPNLRGLLRVASFALLPLLLTAQDARSGNITVQFSGGSANSGRNGLPAASMDSFVHEADEHAELIYGDESLMGPPPYMSFDVTHRIDTGILDMRDAGITTGHGSLMPDAFGRDEFLGQEQSVSGTQGVGEADGFYNGLPYRLDSALPANPQQFPGGYNTFTPVAGQVIDGKWAAPLPVSWNENGGSWTQTGANQWTNSAGETINGRGDITYKGSSDVYYPDGSILYENDPNFPDGTIQAPDGTIINPNGSTSQSSGSRE